MKLTTVAASCGIAYGTYRYFTAFENINKRKEAQFIMGMSAVIFLAGYLPSGGENDSFYNSKVITFPSALEVAGSKCGLVGELVDTFNKTKGLRESNFLEWRKSFQSTLKKGFSGIRPDDLSLSAMWGIDPLRCFFIAVKGSCNGKAEEVQVIFQYHMTSLSKANDVISAYPTRNWACGLNRLTRSKAFLKLITELLAMGETLLGEQMGLGINDNTCKEIFKLSP